MEQLGARLRTIGVDKVVRAHRHAARRTARLSWLCALQPSLADLSPALNADGAAAAEDEGAQHPHIATPTAKPNGRQPPALQSSCPQTCGEARQLAHGVARCAVADEQGDRSQVWTELWALHRENKQVSNTNPAPNSQEGAVKAYGGGRQRVRRQRGSDGGLQQRREQLQFTPRREPG